LKRIGKSQRANIAISATARIQSIIEGISIQYEKLIESKPIHNMIFEIEQLCRERNKEIKKIQDCVRNVIPDESRFKLMVYQRTDSDVIDAFKLLYGGGKEEYGISDAINDVFRSVGKTGKSFDILKKKTLDTIAERYKGYKLKQILIEKSVNNASEEWEYKKMKITFAIMKVTKEGKCVLLFARHNRKRWTSFEPNSKIMDFLGNSYKEGLQEARIMLDKENKYLKNTYKNTMKEIEPLLFGLKISEGL
jgi:hypothetical protein